MAKLIYRGQELDEKVWYRIKNDDDFKKMFDDALDGIYHREPNKCEKCFKECG